ncbi:hypothetical protein, partial [Streptomyces sp. NPDC051994]|uniref:hypothetical protein n=1 Tax=Streptomyces sp. NPDC051994 TaxID=3155287 RepID=UPI003445FBA4
SRRTAPSLPPTGGLHAHQPRTTRSCSESGSLLTDRIHATPLLAAASLEGAVRLAVAEAVTPFKVWQFLEDVPVDGPEDFLERLPRLLGLTLDRWADEGPVAETVRALLQQLTHDEATDVDAMFELGCDLLRRALSSTDIGAVTTHLAQARKQFETAAQAEEARHDARTYAAVCDAILAFGRADAVTITRAADQIASALDQHGAWLHRAHQSAWLQPRRSAEIAWHRLILQLRAAAAALQDDAWMDAWQALDTVRSAYNAARTVCPLAGNTGQVLALLVEPAIEDGFLRQQVFLTQLRRAAQETDQHTARGFDAETARALLAAIDTASQREAPSRLSASDDDPGGAPTARLQRLAPTLLLLLGEQQALSIGGALDNQQLLAVEGLAYDGDIARLKATDPLIVPKLDQLMTELSAHPSFTGEVRRTFSALVEQSLLFLKSRSDITRTNFFGSTKKGDPPPFDYRRKPEGKRKPVEADLQRDVLAYEGDGLYQPSSGCVGRSRGVGVPNPLVITSAVSGMVRPVMNSRAVTARWCRRAATMIAWLNVCGSVRSMTMKADGCCGSSAGVPVRW